LLLQCDNIDSVQKYIYKFLILSQYCFHDFWHENIQMAMHCVCNLKKGLLLRTVVVSIECMLKVKSKGVVTAFLF